MRYFILPAVGLLLVCCVYASTGLAWAENPKRGARAASRSRPIVRHRTRGCRRQRIDFGSPESVFGVYRRSLDNRDWQPFFQVLSPGSQEFQVFEIVFVEGVRVDPKLSRIVAKYFDESKLERFEESMPTEWTLDQTRRLVASCVTDKQRLFVEASSHLYRLGSDLETLSRLRDVVRRGAKAKGMTTRTTFISRIGWVDGNEVHQTERVTSEIAVYFIKINGRWLIATQSEWESAP